MATTDTDRILRAIWLKAAGKPEGLELDCGTYSSAKHYQMRLYKLARPFRDSPAEDPDLANAAERLSISVTKGSSLLKILPVAEAGVLGSLARQIGFNPRDDAAGELEEVERRLQQTLGGVVSDSAANPGANRYKTRS